MASVAFIISSISLIASGFSILAITFALLFARGDLGVEIPFQEVHWFKR